MDANDILYGDVGTRAQPQSEPENIEDLENIEPGVAVAVDPGAIIGLAGLGNSIATPMKTNTPNKLLHALGITISK